MKDIKENKKNKEKRNTEKKIKKKFDWEQLAVKAYVGLTLLSIAMIMVLLIALIIKIVSGM